MSDFDKFITAFKALAPAGETYILGLTIEENCDVKIDLAFPKTLQEDFLKILIHHADVLLNLILNITPPVFNGKVAHGSIVLGADRIVMTVCVTKLESQELRNNKIEIRTETLVQMY